MTNLGEKILLSLLAGIAISLAYTPNQQRRAFRELAKIWGTSSRGLSKEIRNLSKSELIKKITKKGENGFGIELTEKGKLKAMEYHLLKNLKIKEKKWDGKWRVLIFDVPERLRKGRNALRWKIKRLGLYELQKSVFVVPYECKKEIDFIVNFFDLKKYVHYGVLEIGSEEANQMLKSKFKLS